MSARPRGTGSELSIHRGAALSGSPARVPARGRPSRLSAGKPWGAPCPPVHTPTLHGPGRHRARQSGDRAELPAPRTRSPRRAPPGRAQATHASRGSRQDALVERDLGRLTAPPKRAREQSRACTAGGRDAGRASPGPAFPSCSALLAGRSGRGRSAGG